MCTPVVRERDSYSRTSRPWNMPVLSTTVPPPWARKSFSFAARISKISARSMVMSKACSAPGTTDSRASWTATTPSSSAGSGPRTVFTVFTVLLLTLMPALTCPGGVRGGTLWLPSP